MAIAEDLQAEPRIQKKARTIQFHSQETLNNHRRIKRELKVGSALEKANQLLNELDKEIKSP